MTRRSLVIILAALVAGAGAGLALSTSLPARDVADTAAAVDAQAPLVPVSELLARSRARVGAQPRVTLTPPAASGDPALWLGGPSEPAYLRTFGTAPHLAEPMSQLVRTVLYDGALPTETKAAMGLRIAQITGSPYVAAHTARVLRASDRGRALHASLADDRFAAMLDAERLAVEYADLLTRSVHGVSPEQFTRTRAVYDDGEIVELTIVTSFFNYFARFVEGVHLPVEPWTLDGPSAPAPWPGRDSGARVALISDREIEATSAAAEQARNPEAQRRGLGLGMANSQRAMLRAPELALAWRGMGAAFRERQTLPRETMLQVSLAVSTVNGCRYCTIHQVVGLRRQGVDPARLLALRKDDEALTPRERVAVTFARALTNDPAAVSDADWTTLVNEFGEAGAIEVLLQTCNFAFMNRFTDGLALPSEDEAIRIYQETYGTE